MLESFLQAQKVAVRRTLQRSFRKYITYGEESNQLLMHQLRSLVLLQKQHDVNRSKQRRSDNSGFLQACIRAVFPSFELT
jgi:hypothetical protein